MTSRPRVAIIGARRNRQGLGPFVARALRAAGAEVPCFLGTSSATVAAAQADLRRIAGVAPRGHVDPAALLDLDDGPLDAVAILSPAPTHRRWLAWALEARLAVLCEKPFVWDGDDDLGAATELAGGFAAAGLPLWENCQWPYTLAAYGELFPQAAEATPRELAMRLSPSVTGARMIGDSLPHVVSLAQTVAPAGARDGAVALTDVRFSTHDEQATDLTVDFTWPGTAGPLAVRAELIQEQAQPRSAGYALDGRWARRVVRTRDYAQFFQSGARVVDVPDPLHALVADFVDTLAGGGSRPAPGSSADWPPDPRPSDRRIVQRMAALTQLQRSWQSGSRGSP